MDIEARKTLAESLRGREVRRVPASGLELREQNGSLTLSGWASVTERAYDMGYYQETVKRGAFATTLGQAPDVQLLLNHEGLPLARTLSGTLRLAEDDRGLRVDADLNPDDPDVQRLMPKVQRGDIDQMSFAFRVTRQTWDEDYENREIAEVDLNRGDVSVVNQGANPATTFSMRDIAVRFELPGTDEFAHALSELRAGATLSATTTATLQRVLDLIDASDTNVDKALIVLSDLMGVTNPDITQDAALDRAAGDRLELRKAQAYALRLRNKAA